MKGIKRTFMWPQGMKWLLMFLSLVLLTALASRAFGCTIVMAARNGLVLAGNNEDRNHPDTLVNFIPATDRYFGLLGNFEEAIVMNFDKELEKGRRKLTLASLFKAQPSMGSVLQKYIDALGGKEALGKIRTRTLNGKLIHDFPVPNLEDRVRPDPLLFTVEDMQQDFLQLRSILENDHCCLYEYTGKEEFDRIFDEHFKLIDGPMRAEQFFKITASITAKIGCMHTSLWMPGAFFDTGVDNLFPLRVKLIEEKLVVTGCYDGTPEVPVGSIILEINGWTAGDIFDELRATTSSDALNPYFIDSQIEKRFPMFYASVFGFPDKYEGTFALPGKKTRVNADLKPTDIGSVRNVVFANFNHPPLGLEFLEDQSTAVITVKTFSYYDRVDYFRDFLDGKDIFMETTLDIIKNAKGKQNP